MKIEKKLDSGPFIKQVKTNSKRKQIVIYGAGGIGLSVIEAAKAVSAWPIIAIDIFDNRLNLAREIGATHIINGKSGDVENKINSILKNKPLNVFIDNTGSTRIIERGYDLVNNFGRVVLVGVPKKGENISISVSYTHLTLPTNREV